MNKFCGFMGMKLSLPQPFSNNQITDVLRKISLPTYFYLYCFVPAYLSLFCLWVYILTKKQTKNHSNKQVKEIPSLHNNISLSWISLVVLTCGRKTIFSFIHIIFYSSKLKWTALWSLLCLLFVTTEKFSSILLILVSLWYGFPFQFQIWYGIQHPHDQYHFQHALF